MRTKQAWDQGLHVGWTLTMGLLCSHLDWGVMELWDPDVSEIQH
jgi:hypothetical protein